MKKTFDIKLKQISLEERTVLVTLAESVVRSDCKFLEVGSWYGDSTIVLGKVAKEEGGRLFCVDWWKGSVGTDLKEIASRVDVFSYFWDRVCREGLEEVVIPIRGKSDVVSEVLKENEFDLVFIDADHRYECILKDIQKYAPLVKGDGGILCGHDCDGRISDFDIGFLELGKNVDCYESTHCGVVLAVGSTFEEYSINYRIWSVRAVDNGKKWVPTNLLSLGIKDERRLPHPQVGYYKNDNILHNGIKRPFKKVFLDRMIIWIISNKTVVRIAKIIVNLIEKIFSKYYSIPRRIRIVFDGLTHKFIRLYGAIQDRISSSLRQ
jgi:hypothetical protein